MHLRISSRRWCCNFGSPIGPRMRPPPIIVKASWKNELMKCGWAAEPAPPPFAHGSHRPSSGPFPPMSACAQRRAFRSPAHRPRTFLKSSALVGQITAADRFDEEVAHCQFSRHMALAKSVTYMLLLWREDPEYLDVAGESPYRDWFDSLDVQAAAKVTVALTRVELATFQT